MNLEGDLESSTNKSTNFETASNASGQ